MCVAARGGMCVYVRAYVRVYMCACAFAYVFVFAYACVRVCLRARASVLMHGTLDSIIISLQI